jgi:hypothetical protein
MKSITQTPTILLEMVGHSSYTEYLCRPLTRQETSKLSPAEMKARRLAQTRACRHRQKMAEALAKVARHDAYRAAGRDILDLSPRVPQLRERRTNALQRP